MFNKIFLSIALVLMAGCSSRLEIDEKAVAEAFDETSLPYTVLGVSTGENDPQFYSLGGANPNAVFEIASMTKAITATAVMQLVEEGEIDLDVPVANYLPEINEIKILEEDLTTRPGTVPITMRHLLTHTSGIAYSFNSMRIMKALGFAPGDWPLRDGVR